jgi:hypothetical protein
VLLWIISFEFEIQNCTVLVIALVALGFFVVVGNII